jgi:hypothetical protein
MDTAHPFSVSFVAALLLFASESVRWEHRPARHGAPSGPSRVPSMCRLLVAHVVQAYLASYSLSRELSSRGTKGLARTRYLF